MLNCTANSKSNRNGMDGSALLLSAVKWAGYSLEAKLLINLEIAPHTHAIGKFTRVRGNVTLEVNLCRTLVLGDGALIGRVKHKNCLMLRE